MTSQIDPLPEDLTLMDGQNPCDPDSQVGWVSVSVTQCNLGWHWV